MLISRSSIINVVISVTVLCFALGCEKQNNEPKKITKIDETLCQFSQGPCVQKVAKTVVKLEFTPSHAPSEKPIDLTVTTNSEVDSIEMRVEGRDMFMGVIPVNLQQKAKDVYQGTLIYGSCSSDYMVWRAYITVTKSGESQTLLFDFLADNVGS
ncbi:hypothetical protein [Shewanella waksmanii]|uniref:hypothetical protein n=1 Tax=Shewanella waksmanii TaxID=213783 RepID=UPI003736B32B